MAKMTSSEIYISLKTDRDRTQVIKLGYDEFLIMNCVHQKRSKEEHPMVPKRVIPSYD